MESRKSRRADFSFDEYEMELRCKNDRSTAQGAFATSDARQFPAASMTMSRRRRASVGRVLKPLWQSARRFAGWGCPPGAATKDFMRWFILGIELAVDFAELCRVSDSGHSLADSQWTRAAFPSCCVLSQVV